MVDEEWKEIKNYEGYYQISNFGRVKSLDRIVSGCDGKSIPHKGRILKPLDDGRGYHHIFLNKNGKYKVCKIHRLVGEYFIDNPFNKPYINHIDGIKTNNHQDNLEWVTASENQLHAIKTKLRNIRKPIKRLTTSQVKKIKEDNRPQRQIAKSYDINPSTVWRIKSGKTWKHI